MYNTNSNNEKPKRYVTDFSKKKENFFLINLNGFTLNFIDILCQKFNLRKKNIIII